MVSLSYCSLRVKEKAGGTVVLSSLIKTESGGHTDERRSIHDINLSDGSAVNVFEIFTDKLPLGNHYHKDKDELFIVITGGMTVIGQMVNPETGDPTGERETQTVKAPAVIEIPRGYAHAFVRCHPGTRMACLSSKVHDPNDLHPFLLEK